jgi:hypothetical protein
LPAKTSRKNVVLAEKVLGFSCKTSLLWMEEILHQLIEGLSHYLQVFNHLRWCRISSIHSRFHIQWACPVNPDVLASLMQTFRPPAKLGFTAKKKRDDSGEMGMIPFF